MKQGSRPHRLSAKPGLELIEEAVHLLRVSPAAVLWPYYLGAIPFVLGLLYFWTEMSRSAYAERHLSEAALGLALLFTWMKFWQNVFATHLRARLEGNEPALPDFKNAVKAWITQTWIQATGLFLLPLAFLTVLGFTWVYAFYQSVTAQTIDTSRSRTTVRQAHRLALLTRLFCASQARLER